MNSMHALNEKSAIFVSYINNSDILKMCGCITGN